VWWRAAAPDSPSAFFCGQWPMTTTSPRFCPSVSVLERQDPAAPTTPTPLRSPAGLLHCTPLVIHRSDDDDLTTCWTSHRSSIRAHADRPNYAAPTPQDDSSAPRPRCIAAQSTCLLGQPPNETAPPGHLECGDIALHPGLLRRTLSRSPPLATPSRIHRSSTGLPLPAERRRPASPLLQRRISTDCLKTRSSPDKRHRCRMNILSLVLRSKGMAV
jgi:hypothetical protein